MTDKLILQTGLCSQVSKLSKKDLRYFLYNEWGKPVTSGKTPDSIFADDKIGAPLPQDRISVSLHQLLSSDRLRYFSVPGEIGSDMI